MAVHRSDHSDSPAEHAPSSPKPLQNPNIARNDVRPYSYIEIPRAMQRPQFHVQTSSPTDSKIDESPTTPEHYQPLVQALTDGANSSYPVEKIPPERTGSSHNFAQSADVHLAHFAPYEEQTLPLDPIVRKVSEQTLPHQQQHLIPQLSQDQKPAIPMAISTEYHNVHQFTSKKRPIYDPDSFTGPNVSPKDHRPGQVSHPNSSIEPQWKHGFCELDTTCCVGLLCPCVIYGKIQYRLSQKAQKRDATDLLGYESINGPCGLMAAACGFQWVFASIQRTRIRKLYHVKGSFGSDCIKSLCCCCCVLMQGEREVRDREEMIRRFAGPASAAYATPETMTYAPPPR